MLKITTLYFHNWLAQGFAARRVRDLTTGKGSWIFENRNKISLPKFPMLFQLGCYEYRTVKHCTWKIENSVFRL